MTNMGTQYFDSGGPVTVGTDFTTLLTVTLNGEAEYLSAEIENLAAGAAFSDFKVLLQDNPGGEFYSFLSATDFDTLTDNLVWVAGAVANTTPRPQKLATGAFGHIRLHVPAVHAIRFQAKCGTSTTAKVRGTAA